MSRTATVFASNLPGRGLRRVYVNGKPVDACVAYNVSEGWADVYEYINATFTRDVRRLPTVASRRIIVNRPGLLRRADGSPVVTRLRGKITWTDVAHPCYGHPDHQTGEQK